MDRFTTSECALLLCLILAGFMYGASLSVLSTETVCQQGFCWEE